ncbi:ABC-F family ATP-binding cassette domain-containing protein [Rickettsiales endosymbiont of Stachyamoeba lipophora]|uniref:ABC-F family ATP-binding cassette domain-containing protein n=1 Tax=Rickettsiales endosymbiont of Stachyamoeba lipophora TaxID=2486578 RepID=UPI000F652667|nr:ATP-binding cassette domain-containing protein [Rickettsiales endosymbiont of Stachyamoeba lipophora]AZL15277.1 ABC transporter ATP-binding protein [Rickettsiales endosymbiont of Stachyamoeba lipophora]
MLHRPIIIKNLSLFLAHKACFIDFNAQIQYGDRIAIIGHNGSGKSSLLKIINGEIEPSEGEIHIPKNAIIGYIPQIIDDFSQLSGGQRFNQSLTQALSLDPNILLPDEPTNHLDLKNRRSFIRSLRKFPGTLIIVSHDVEILRTCVDTVWHIDNGSIKVFSGDYDDYINKIKLERDQIGRELELIEREKKEVHKALMKEQERFKKSKLKGAKSFDGDKILAHKKSNCAQQTAGNKYSSINDKKEVLTRKLSDIRLPEMMLPKFNIDSSKFNKHTLVNITEGSCGYDNSIIISGINLSISLGERVAIKGDNGSGKSTLIRAIINHPEVSKSGNWEMPNNELIGYLDQHYNNIHLNKTVLENIHGLHPAWSHTEVRRHLNDFLFRKNEEVSALASTLSGGEKARLTLAQIASLTPPLLILDEITNNLDLETKDHIIQVIQNYPGTLIVISHEEDFLDEITINTTYHIIAGKLITA